MRYYSPGETTDDVGYGQPDVEKLLDCVIGKKKAAELRDIFPNYTGAKFHYTQSRSRFDRPGRSLRDKSGNDATEDITHTADGGTAGDRSYW